MSILDQRKLIESIHPFELLSPMTLDNLMKKIDIAYYPKNTLLISKNLPSIAFYIIIKGSVNEYIDEELHNVYGEGDSFDADALIYSKTEAKFTVDEDLICYEIKKEDFLLLLEDKRVQSYFLQDFVTRHQHLKDYEAQGDLTPFLMSKVSDMYLHKACVVEKNETIFNSLKKMKSLKAKVIIIKDEPYKILTDSDFIDKVLLAKVDTDASIGSISAKSLISIDINDFLFNALLLMTHHSVKRVVVMKDGEIAGILEQLDMLSYFANHSHLVVVQIDKASSVAELKNIQGDLRNLIAILHSKGVKARYITKLVSTLNEKIYAKVFDLCVEEGLKEKCALLVMGSEGRAEQALKTDQDNALIIEDGIDVSLFEEPMMKLNAALLEIGYPKCSGNVMVSNEFWRRNVDGYKTLIDSWIGNFSEENLQSLSIFLDAKCVCGNTALLVELQEYLQRVFSARDDVLAHMAKAVLNFETPLSLFSNFVLEKSHDNKLDLKKGGIFALVHGVRILSLKHSIKETNTIERLKVLNNKGVIDKEFATELIESFDTLSSIRLNGMLESLDIQESNYINPKKLEKNQRDLLKDSFKIVNKFKKFMIFHFHLEMVS
ncbi:MAG: cyclic nucleotide-binding domain-containing protein [Sulfurimonas sp.]|nr:cyclic nucleotide-binding domain-containing protein [Sulfurimonas sp.]MBU3939988.1 cyclic nucleotide-binding domain-containing protein [bacterium]MBU4058573.1 cyclic nucleotide-binding domain-containing protein [bacterium]